MKTIINPTVYMIVKTWSAGRRENIAICLNEDTAKQLASREVGEGFFIHLETCKLVGTFLEEDNGRLKE